MMLLFICSYLNEGYGQYGYGRSRWPGVSLWWNPLAVPQDTVRMLGGSSVSDRYFGGTQSFGGDNW